jgi:hypothetical protein
MFTFFPIYIEHFLQTAGHHSGLSFKEGERGDIGAEEGKEGLLLWLAAGFLLYFFLKLGFPSTKHCGKSVWKET